MASEKLNNLIEEFASDGIISENELALLQEKATEESISQTILQGLISKALASQKQEVSDASGFISMPQNIENKNNSSNDKSGFIDANSENEANEASGFLAINDSTIELKDTEKSIFIERDSFFKSEQLLPKQGSMSETYVGIRHIRKVVIKRLKPEHRKDKKRIKLLYQEFQNALVLEHPNIVRVYDSGQDNKGPYYYMEYIDGRVLSDVIPKFGIQNHNIVKKIALEILSALSYVHKKQIFHRDLKPGNILITYKGENTKMLDFGLAMADDFKDNMLQVGTPKYAAPEQKAINSSVDGRSDLYSFGLILAEMITGDIRNLDKVGSYSKKMRKIIERCTEELPHNRYFTASDIIVAIEKLEVIKNRFADVEVRKVEPVKAVPVKTNKRKTTDVREEVRKLNAERKANKEQREKEQERERERLAKHQLQIKKSAKKKKKSSLGIWVFFIILAISGYYIGRELGYWNESKNETTYSVQEPKIMYLKAKKLRLRSSKSFKEKNVIGIYRQGTMLQIIEINDNWAKVKVENKEGYMAFPKKYFSEEKEK